MSDALYWTGWGIINSLFATINIAFVIMSVKENRFYGFSLFVAIVCGSIGIADFIKALLPVK